MTQEGQGEALPEVPVSNETVPEVVDTASTAEAPISGEETPEAKEQKTLSQEEVDAIVAKRLAKAQRKWQREQDQRIAEMITKTQPTPAPNAKPTPDKFTTTEEYVEAVAEWKADQKISEKLTALEQQQRERQELTQRHQALESFREREDVARDKYSDFDEVAYNPALPITQAMAETIQESESGCDLAYFLGKNPQEAARIAKLSPFLQAKELGRLEAKLASAPAPKKPSGAPAPISPVKASGGQSTYTDTTDPKSLEKLGTSAWIEAERQRQIRDMQARNR